MAVRRLIDIGANLTDPMYQGVYHGIKRHAPDVADVVARAWAAGLDRIVVTGGSATESRVALEIATTEDRLYTTVGCHPTRCSEWKDDPDAYYASLLSLIEDNRDKVIAVGECGLDYDRLEFCDKDTQKEYFKRQLSLSQETGLPLFLHCRNAATDILDILDSCGPLNGGVVHSFDGTQEHAQEFVRRGYYIGINGCSLKTEANLETARCVPVDRLLIETDSPWCEVRPSHAGSKHVKTTFPSVKKEKWKPGHLIKCRNEPATLCQILEILSAIRGTDADSLSEQVYNNTIKLFFPSK